MFSGRNLSQTNLGVYCRVIYLQQCASLLLIYKTCVLYCFRHVDISGCYKGVTDIGIQSLTKCSDLAHLNISYLSKVGGYLSCESPVRLWIPGFDYESLGWT